MPMFMSHQQAKALGLRYYRDGWACNRGHYAERYTSSGSCVVCLAMTGKARYTPRPRRITPPTALQIAWAAARSEGVGRFYTGKPCRNGHVVARLTSDGECSECKRLERAKRRGIQGRL
jgi:hypothetical protein